MIIKQLVLPFLGVAAFIAVVGLMMQGKINLAGGNIVKIGNVELKVKIADSPQERSKGLSGISSLPENEGVFFVFAEKDTTPSFWMKDMLIPLDIIWINDGKIVKIDKNVPISDPNKLYSPSQPIDYVLEVNAGFSDKNGLEVGDLAEGDPIQN